MPVLCWCIQQRVIRRLAGPHWARTAGGRVSRANGIPFEHALAEPAGGVLGLSGGACWGVLGL